MPKETLLRYEIPCELCLQPTAQGFMYSSKCETHEGVQRMVAACSVECFGTFSKMLDQGCTFRSQVTHA